MSSSFIIFMFMNEETPDRELFTTNEPGILVHQDYNAEPCAEEETAEDSWSSITDSISNECGSSYDSPDIVQRLAELRAEIEANPVKPRNAFLLERKEPDPSPISPDYFQPEFGSAHISICLNRLEMRAAKINVSSIRKTVLAGLKQAHANLNSKDSNVTRVAQYCKYVSDEISDALSYAKYTQRVITVRNKRSAKKIANRPDARSWFHLPMGIEYTFHFPENVDGRDWGLGTASKICDAVKQRVKEKTSKSKIAGRVYIDQSVLEVCSPVHKNWQDMSDWYDWMYTQAKEFKLRPFNPKKGGGGGHVNTSIPYVSKGKKKKKVMNFAFMRNMITDIANRPYINWVFNDPSDNHTANCLWWYGSTRNMYEKFESSKDAEKLQLIREISGRGYAIRVKDDFHFEFRCFDMVRNKKDLIDYAKFVSAYTRWIMEKTEAGEVISIDERLRPLMGTKKSKLSSRLFEISSRITDTEDRVTQGEQCKPEEPVETITCFNDMKSVISEFKALLVTLGLQYKDYRRFVERNLKVRMQEPYGKEYLM